MAVSSLYEIPSFLNPMLGSSDCVPVEKNSCPPTNASLAGMAAFGSPERRAPRVNLGGNICIDSSVHALTRHRAEKFGCAWVMWFFKT